MWTTWSIPFLLIQVVHADKYVHSTYLQVLGEFLYSAMNRTFRRGGLTLAASGFSMGKIIDNGSGLSESFSWICLGFSFATPEFIKYGSYSM